MESSIEKGNFYFSKNNYSKAVYYLEKFVKNNKRDDDQIISLSYYKLALSYFELNRFNDSINTSKKLSKKNIDPEIQFKNYRLLSLVFYKKGEYKNSLNSIHLAYDLLKDSSDFKDEDYSELYNDLANIYSMFNEYKKSIDFRLEAIKTIEKDKSNLYLLGLYYNNLGVTCNNIIRFYGNDAFQNLKNIKIYSCFTKAINFVKINKSSNGLLNLANVYNNISFYFRFKRDSRNELQCLLKSIKTLDKIKGDVDYYLANSFINLGTYYFRNNNLKKGLKYLIESLEIRTRILGSTSLIIIKNYLYIGNCFEKQNKFTEALKNYQTALDILSPGKSKIDILKTPDVSQITFLPELIEVLQSKISSLNSLFKETITVKYLDSSYNCIFILSNLLKKKKKNLTGVESKSLLSARASSIYENSIDIFFELFHITNNNDYLDKAFEYIGKCKALSLLENLNENEAKTSSAIPNDLTTKEDQIKVEINFKEKQIFEEKRKASKSVSIKKLESELFILKEELSDLIKIFEKKYKLYYNLKYDVNIATIVEIQSRLNKYDTLIEYFAGEENIFIFIIKRDITKIHHIPKSKSFDRKLKQFRKCLSLSDTVNNDFQKFSTLSHYFYKLLLKDYIPEDTGNLIIIPDGLLNYIPFEVLITDKPKTGNFKNVSYLLERYNISYSYSSTLLLRNLSKSLSKSSSKPKILGFAPSFNKESKSKVKEDALRSGLNSLKWNSAELKSAKKYFGGRIFLNEKASKKEFVKYSSDYPVLHFATHGIVEDKNPMFSKIAFAPVTDNIDDGYLHAYELYGMKLNSDLTILSACDTGYGKLIKGEGVMSIARGFLYAGSKSIMMSLWQVSDSATCKIIGYFYKYLSKGMSKNEALRKAKLDYIKSSDSIKANPAYWAPFVLIGNTNPL